MKSSKLRDVTAVFAKILEVISFVGAGLALLGLITIVAMKDQVIKLYTNPNFSLTTTSGFDLSSVNESNIVPTFVVLLITGIVIAILAGFMFRNINQVFRVTNTASPFDISNVNRIKRIGYLALSLPLCKLVTNIVLGLIVKNISIGLEASEILSGLIILCIAQYFAYGASLEKDVEGLL